jgi:hypothetical protein
MLSFEPVCQFFDALWEQVTKRNDFNVWISSEDVICRTRATTTTPDDADTDLVRALCKNRWGRSKDCRCGSTTNEPATGY